MNKLVRGTLLTSASVFVSLLLASPGTASADVHGRVAVGPRLQNAVKARKAVGPNWARAVQERKAVGPMWRAVQERKAVGPRLQNAVRDRKAVGPNAAARQQGLKLPAAGAATLDLNAGF